ncbi:MAG: hypothetical protein WAZ18_06925 [Alphaproteobacteria bacterium]
MNWDEFIASVEADKKEAQAETSLTNREKFRARRAQDKALEPKMHEVEDIDKSDGGVNPHVMSESLEGIDFQVFRGRLIIYDDDGNEISRH